MIFVCLSSFDFPFKSVATLSLNMIQPNVAVLEKCTSQFSAKTNVQCTFILCNKTEQCKGVLGLCEQLTCGYKVINDMLA